MVPPIIIGYSSLVEKKRLFAKIIKECFNTNTLLVVGEYLSQEGPRKCKSSFICY